MQIDGIKLNQQHSWPHIWTGEKLLCPANHQQLGAFDIDFDHVNPPTRA